MKRHVCEITPELSRWFTTMSFVSAISIVALHSLSADKSCLLVRWIYDFVVGGVCETAIPWFFFAAAKVFCLEVGARRAVVMLDSIQLPALTFTVFLLCRGFRLPDSVTALSFPVYVTHMLVVLCISSVYGAIGIGGAGNITIAKSGVRFLLALAGSAFVSILTRKLLPRFARIAFGGR